jgi:ClpP class serine protease
MEPFSELKEKDVEIIKNMLAQIHEAFKDHVRQSRQVFVVMSSEVLVRGIIRQG